jgi:hypothetical protein
MLFCTVFLYIGVWVLYENRGYLKYETASGVLNVNLQRPKGMTDLTTFPYCTQYTGPSAATDQKPCTTWDENDVVFPKDQYGLFATTRVTLMNEKRMCDETALQCLQPWSNTSDPKSYYIADIESFTIRVRHR